MNVSTSGPMKFTDNTDAFIDFSSGLPASNYTAPSLTDEYAALAVYLKLLEKYQDMLLPALHRLSQRELYPRGPVHAL